eukprot:52118_1
MSLLDLLGSNSPSSEKEHVMSRIFEGIRRERKSVETLAGFFDSLAAVSDSLGKSCGRLSKHSLGETGSLGKCFRILRKMLGKLGVEEIEFASLFRKEICPMFSKLASEIKDGAKKIRNDVNKLFREFRKTLESYEKANRQYQKVVTSVTDLASDARKPAAERQQSAPSDTWQFIG